jgi:hypothetical protein
LIFPILRFHPKFLVPLAAAYSAELTIMDGKTGIAADRTFAIAVQPNGRISGTFATQAYTPNPILQQPSRVTGAITLRPDGSTFDILVTVANDESAFFC